VEQVLPGSGGGGEGGGGSNNVSKCKNDKIKGEKKVPN
jgi:hypothetical protein